ncbi:MAG: serine hydroxymethyltransferase, partial [Candidatus Marinimicrobia bacterium]|nr:serine hydroxymethyltransferase [Candidatus Neomarinimicrobiota bacterium]
KDRENPFGITASKSGRVKMMSEILDSTVMPGIQGGPLMHIIAAKAVALGEALKPEFKIYCKQIIKNAKILADALLRMDFDLVSGGTDNHLILIDLRNKNITGKSAEKALEKAGITVNKNMVPFDTKSPFVTSGIRIGTPALTTRGFKEPEMEQIAHFINRVITDPVNEKNLLAVRKDVEALTDQFPLYADLLNKYIQ